MLLQQVLLQQRLLHLLRQPAKTAPVIRHRAAAMRDQELQCRKVLEQIRGQALHECRRVGIEVMRAGGVEAGIAACRDVDHGRDVELHHLLVDRIPLPVRQRRRGPVPARWVGVEVDADEAVFLDAFLHLGDAGFWIDARRLRQHRRADEAVRKQLATRAHNSLQIAAQVEDTLKSPMWCAMKLARGLKIVRSLPRSCIFLSWLLTIDSRSSSSLIFSSLTLGFAEGSLDSGDLPVAPVLERFRRGGVMAVHVDDQFVLPFG